MMKTLEQLQIKEDLFEGVNIENDRIYFFTFESLLCVYNSGEVVTDDDVISKDRFNEIIRVRALIMESE